MKRRIFLFLLSVASSVAAADFPELKPVSLPAGAGDYWPCFSRDGKELIFSRRSGEQPWQLYIAPVKGGSARLLFDPPPAAVATRASRSAKGRLAFTGAGTIWVTDAEGLNPRRLTLTGLNGNPSYPSWYPDEVHLLVVAYRKDQGGVLYQIDTASGQAEAITDPAELLCGMPAVSPDGKSVIFAGQKNEGQVYDQTKNRIWLLPEKGAARPLSPDQGRAATWSPDGHWIAYESTEGSPDEKRHAIFLISPEGKDHRRITSYVEDPNHPVWSPDGRWIAVSTLDPDHPGRTRISILPAPVGP